ncbi:MAG TPA: ribonuclease III [Dehalococcoidia bacterium]|nr:ribonuclease III [Dehalococcoidia bacterium]
MPDWKLLQRKLGVRFADLPLLQQALVHRSYLNEMPDSGLESNERLEFLGDAVLGLVVAGKLYEDYPQHPEGLLTEMRVALVRRDTLARIAKSLSLGDYLFLGRGEEAAGGSGRPSNLSAAYEAVVGAIFVDGGMQKAKRFVVNSLTSEFRELPKGRTLANPKSQLQELLQARLQKAPVYKLLRDEGPDHSKVFTVQVWGGKKPLGIGQGKSKQQAEKEAARDALQKIALKRDSDNETKTGTDS